MIEGLGNYFNVTRLIKYKTSQDATVCGPYKKECSTEYLK